MENGRKLSLNHPLIGVIAGIIIFFCAVYIGNTIKNTGWFEPETAAAIDSKSYVSSSEVKTGKLSAQEVYSIAKNFEAPPSDLGDDITVTGAISATYFDDFNKLENSHTEYFITAGNEKFSLHPTNDLGVISGGTFKVTGKKIGNTIVVENKDIEGMPNFGGPSGPGPGGAGDGPTPPPDSVGNQKTLVLLVRYQDSPGAPVSNQEVNDLIFKGQFQKFYKEQSYGNVSFSGKVMGWYTLPRSCNSTWPTYGTTQNHEVEDLIIANNIDLSGYDHLVIVPQSTEGATGCLSGNRGWSTLGKVIFPVGPKKFKISITGDAISNYYLSSPYPYAGAPAPSISLFENVLIHEIGHALGVMHANALDCGETSLGTNCNHIEYGNAFDVMGDEAYSLHFNAFYKELLGWIPPENSLLITRSGRYTINSLETTGANQKNFAKIQRANSASTPFYLEYRRGVGFDSWLNQNETVSNQSGLFVNLIRKNPGAIASFPHLLDMQPTSQAWSQDVKKVTLNMGSEFNDPSNGIKIGPVISVSTSSVTFDVTIDKPTCVHRSPSMWMYPPVSLSIVAGHTGQANISFQNADSITCGESKFNVETNAPSDWQRQVVPANDVGLRPTDSYYGEASKNINLTIPANTPTGTYPTTFSVMNKSTGLRKDYQINVLVAGAPVIYNINPGGGPIGTPTAIAGTGFGTFPKIIMIGAQGRFSANFPSDGSLVQFPIPATITEPFCNCQIPTPPGAYDTYVYANGLLSTPWTFQVTQ